MYSRHETAKPLISSDTVRQRINAAGHVASRLRHAPHSVTGVATEHAGERYRNHPSSLAALDQQGSARIRFPNSGQGPLQAVLINTAGGLTGDDDIRWSATAGEHSRLVTSTAACEKLYRTHGPAARQSTRLTVENGARLDWLPQETIVFDGSSLQRHLEADVAADATALIVECVGSIRPSQRRNRGFDSWYWQ